MLHKMIAFFVRPRKQTRRDKLAQLIGSSFGRSLSKKRRK